MSAPRAWSHPASLAELARGSAAIRLVAGETERAAVAGALGAVAVKRLEADLAARPWLDGAEIGGRIVALVTRVCGVSLDEFDEAVDASFTLRLAPPGSPNAPAPIDGEIAIDLDADDPPDELTAETADLAVYVVEHLALALDPFPRKPGAVFQAPAPDPAPSPFAALATLKRGLDGD